MCRRHWVGPVSKTTCAFERNLAPRVGHWGHRASARHKERHRVFLHVGRGGVHKGTGSGPGDRVRDHHRVGGVAEAAAVVALVAQQAGAGVVGQAVAVRAVWTEVLNVAIMALEAAVGAVKPGVAHTLGLSTGTMTTAVAATQHASAAVGATVAWVTEAVAHDAVAVAEAIITAHREHGAVGIGSKRIARVALAVSLHTSAVIEAVVRAQELLRAVHALPAAVAAARAIPGRDVAYSVTRAVIEALGLLIGLGTALNHLIVAHEKASRVRIQVIAVQIVLAETGLVKLGPGKDTLCESACTGTGRVEFLHASRTGVRNFRFKLFQLEHDGPQGITEPVGREVGQRRGQRLHAGRQVAPHQRRSELGPCRDVGTGAPRVAIGGRGEQSSAVGTSKTSFTEANAIAADTITRARLRTGNGGKKKRTIITCPAIFARTNTTHTGAMIGAIVETNIL